MPQSIVPTKSHMNSQEIADLTHGIPDVKPKSISDVHKAIGNMLSKMAIESVEIVDAKMHLLDSIDVYHVMRNKKFVERYYLNRRLVEILITGWSVQIRARVIDKLHALEEAKETETVNRLISVIERLEQRLELVESRNNLLESRMNKMVALPAPSKPSLMREFTFCKIRGIRQYRPGSITKQAKRLAKAHQRENEIDWCDKYDVHLIPKDLLELAAINLGLLVRQSDIFNEDIAK